MKCITLTILILAISLSAWGGGPQGTEWGMNYDEVKAAIPDKKWKGPKGGISLKKKKRKIKYLYYYDKTKSDDEIIWHFWFNDKKLFKAVNTIIEVGILERANVVGLYSKYLADLTEMHGDPLEGGGCQNHTSPEEAIEKINSGRSECHETWKVDDTRIDLLLRCENVYQGKCTTWEPILTYLQIKKPDDSEVEENP